MGKSVCLGLGVLLAINGCSSTTDGDGNNNMNSAGSGGPQLTAGTSASGAGTTASNTTAGSSGRATGMSGSGAGTGSQPPAAGTTGTAGIMETAGSGGATDTAGAGGSGGPDTSGFIENCVQGGAQWGTPQQKGPCKSGTSIYGVTQQFGPYGAASEYNVGQGFETTVGFLDTPEACSLVIDGFGADPIGSADLKMLHDLNLALYTVFYPGVMPEGEKFPLITWGNGTCAMPEGYGSLLRYLASFGYIIVAANQRYVGSGEAQRKALDFMFAENQREGSKYFGKIDTEKVGAMGHSQGSSGTAAASSDERIKAVILWNGGAQANKPYLAVSGERDIGDTGSPTVLSNPVMASSRPAAYLYYHQVPETVKGQPTGGVAGHLTLMMEPERVTEVTVAWWDMMLKGSATAKQMFIGDNCGLCDNSKYPSMWVTSPTPPSITYGHNSMLQ